MAENDEREGPISDLPTEEDSMQIEEDQTATSVLDSDCDDQEYLVLNLERENFVVETIDKFFDPNVLMSS